MLVVASSAPRALPESWQQAATEPQRRLACCGSRSAEEGTTDPPIAPWMSTRRKLLQRIHPGVDLLEGANS